MANITISAETHLILFLEESAKKKGISKSAVATQALYLYQRLYGGDGTEIVDVLALIRDQLAKLEWKLEYKISPIQKKSQFDEKLSI